MVEAFTDWIVDNASWRRALLGLALAVATMVASLAIVSVVLVRLQATYFAEHHSRDFLAERHAVTRLAARIAKNVLGVALVVLGAILALPGIPGQGLLTILIGLMLLDVPGRRRLERTLVGYPPILREINRLRTRFGRPPLEL